MRRIYRSNPQIVVSGSELYCEAGYLGEKESHKFVKEVVSTGKVNIKNLPSLPSLINRLSEPLKTAVFNHLLASNFQLKVGDLVYLACQHGHIHMVRTMMESKVRIGGLESVDVIAVQRIDPNRVTKYGWTALEISAINGRTEIVRMLVTDHGADVNLKNINNHFTPLENAIEGGHLDTVRVMMEELNAQFRGTGVADLETAAAVVISQG